MSNLSATSRISTVMTRRRASRRLRSANAIVDLAAVVVGAAAGAVGAVVVAVDAVADITDAAVGRVARAADGTNFGR